MKALTVFVYYSGYYLVGGCGRLRFRQIFGIFYSRCYGGRHLNDLIKRFRSGINGSFNSGAFVISVLINGYSSNRRNAANSRQYGSKNLFVDNIISYSDIIMQTA